MGLTIFLTRFSLLFASWTIKSIFLAKLVDLLEKKIVTFFKKALIERENTSDRTWIWNFWKGLPNVAIPHTDIAIIILAEKVVVVMVEQSVIFHNMIALRSGARKTNQDSLYLVVTVVV